MDHMLQYLWHESMPDVPDGMRFSSNPWNGQYARQYTVKLT